MSTSPKWITALDRFLTKVPSPFDSIIAVIVLTAVIYAPWAGFWMFITWDWTWVFSGWSRVSLGFLATFFTYVMIFQD